MQLPLGGVHFPQAVCHIRTYTFICIHRQTQPHTSDTSFISQVHSAHSIRSVNTVILNNKTKDTIYRSHNILENILIGSYR